MINFSHIRLLLGIALMASLGLQIQRADAQNWISKVPLKEEDNSVLYQALSDFGGNQYTTTIYGRDLEGVRKWKEGAELPIGMGSVRSTAQKAFKQAYPQFSQFELESINILHLALVDDWVIQVEFNDPKAPSSEDKTINLLVLLDGRVILPAESAK
jgi:hypothetical protein